MPEPIFVTFLGTGCGIPSLKRHHPAILLRYRGEHLLFDCGENAQLQLQAAGISAMKISKIFITHWHADHFGGLLPLIETLHLSGRKKPLEIFAPEASRFVDALVELSYCGIGFKIIAKDVDHEKKKQKIFEHDAYEIYSVPVKHSIPAVGYVFKEKDHWKIDIEKARRYGLQGPILKELKQKKKILFKGKTITLGQIAYLKKGRKVVYSGDTEACKNLFSAAAEADLLIHDGTFFEEREGQHSSVKQVAALAKKYKIKKLVLTHLSRRYKSAKPLLKAVKPVFANSAIAEDLMKVKV